MRRSTTLLSIALLLAACDSGPPREERAEDRYALELADCAAYYAVMADCVQVKNDADRAQVVQVKLLALRALEMSTELSTEEVARARVDNATDRINAKLDNQCRNPEPVMQEYGEICIAAVDDPQARASFWLENTE